MEVHKLEGDCLIDATQLTNAVAQLPADLIVVVGPVGDAAEHLAGLTAAVRGQDAAEVEARYAALHEAHARHGALPDEVTEQLAGLRALADAGLAAGALSPQAEDRILAAGPRMAAALIARALEGAGRSATVHPAEDFIATDAQFGAARPARGLIPRMTQAILGPDLDQGRVPVVPGGVGRGPSGATTTLGPGGADQSSSLIADALAAERVVLWTATPGLLTADAPGVQNPRVVTHLHYREAAELSFYGSGLLNPRATIPAQARGIPVHVRSLAAPHGPDTQIDGRFTRGAQPVKAIRAIRHQALLSVEGQGMAGVPGISARVFGALAERGISATMISQASSESTICLAVKRAVAESAAAAVKEALRRELSRGEVEDVAVRRHAGLVAAVGLGMARTPGIAARVMQTLADAELNVLAIAQGSSELNITVAVDTRDVDRAVADLHRAFALHETGAPPVWPEPIELSPPDPASEPPPARAWPVTAAADVGPATVLDPSPAADDGRSPREVVTSFAPATVANLGLGFDILGLAIDGVGDRVIARRSGPPGVRIHAVFGDDGRLPRDPTKNTAGIAATATMRAAGLETGIDLELHKGLPLGSGLGSSAASAAAAAVAVNTLLGHPLRPAELIGPCMEAEAVVSAPHADNVAPALMGGLVLIRALDPLDVIRLPLPPGLTVAVVTPSIEVNTRDSRQVLPSSVSLPELVQWTANLAALTCACFTGDLDLLARCITEDAVTASRAGLIPGCREVIRAAREAGGLGSSISGSGPSVFALCRSPEDGERVAASMQAAFQAHGLASRKVVSLAECAGARVL